MIQSALMTIAMTTTLIYGVTGAFDTARATANNVANVYEVAGSINPMVSSYEQRNQMNDRLFNAAGRLDKLASYAQSVDTTNGTSPENMILGFSQTL